MPRIIEKTLESCPMRIGAYCLMSHHWHLYQGRYKSFPVESDDDFYQVARYVERNALRANLVSRAEDWRWSSLGRRVYGQRRGSAVVEQMAVDPPCDPAVDHGRIGPETAGSLPNNSTCPV